MKKLIISLLLGTGLIATAQQSASPVVRFQSLLNGWNLHVATNATATIGATNLLFTNPQGQVLYSLTNNVINGTLYTNVYADAFQYGSIAPDVNGDVNANASLAIYIGNTNWIPVVVTNSVGQFYVTNWLLAAQQFPIWQYPATTNYYQGYLGNATNVVTVTLYRVANFRANVGSALASDLNIGETTSSFSCAVTANGITPVCLITNLPTGFIQGGYKFYASITASTLLNASPGVLVNSLGIIQPRP